MLPNSQLHLLKKIEKRRRYRNWFTALQLAMVLFFGDQILKTWCSSHLAVGQTRPVYAETVQITRVPRHGFFQERVAPLHSSVLSGLASALPAIVFVLLLTALWLRLSEAGLGELCAFATAISGSVSNLLSNTFWGYMTATLRVAIGPTHFLLFNLADLALFLGGLILLRSLTVRLLAELRFLLTRQTG